jgi:hypothetical protein
MAIPVTLMESPKISRLLSRIILTAVSLGPVSKVNGGAEVHETVQDAEAKQEQYLHLLGEGNVHVVYLRCR